MSIFMWYKYIPTVLVPIWLKPKNNGGINYSRNAQEETPESTRGQGTAGEFHVLDINPSTPKKNFFSEL